VLRLPQNLKSGLSPQEGPSPLEAEIMAEKAASLGRAGKRVERILTELKVTADGAAREQLVSDAADAVYSLLVQRELCGLINSEPVFQDYAVPREVIARLGAKRP
jgi:hypothetical protein